MKKVQLADRLGNLQTKRIGFSWLYFFLGPVYSLVRLRILYAILECILIMYLTPIPGMEQLCELIMKIGFIPQNVLQGFCNFLLFFRVNYYWAFGIFIVSMLHIYMSFYFNSRLLRRAMKKKELLPFEEKDARLLIKYHAAKETISLADSFDLRSTNNYKHAEENWYENNISRINHRPSSVGHTSTNVIDNSKTKTTQFEQLKNSYRLGLISESEYKDKYKTLVEKNKNNNTFN